MTSDDTQRRLAQRSARAEQAASLASTAGQPDAGSGDFMSAARAVAVHVAGLHQLIVSEADKHRSGFDETLRVRCRHGWVASLRTVVCSDRCIESSLY